MSTILPIRDGNGAQASGVDPYSPAKDKAASGGLYSARAPPILRRLRLRRAATPSRLILALALFGAFVFVASWLGSLEGRWVRPLDSSSSSLSSSSRLGYTVLINTWKRNSLLKQAVAHYAWCGGTEAIHVVWSESDPPSESLKVFLENVVFAKSQSKNKPDLVFDINEEDNLNNRFKPMKGLSTEAIFSVDDDVIVPCHALDFAFTVMRSAPFAMVGLSLVCIRSISRLPNGLASYEYLGWWSVWWMGTYSMVLSKAAFFHKKYLDLYTYEMPSPIRDYVSKERNCEDIAMSLLVANATVSPPIWVKGKIFETGSSGISSLKGHNKRRIKCLNDFVSLYGKMPLVSTNFKAVDARDEWFW